MKHTFCTLFDSHYLTRGLAMYRSLKDSGIDFHLYVFAFNEQAYLLLKKMNLPDVSVISLKEFENEKLLAVKPTRSRAEYCWTCTSSSIVYVFDHFKTADCTYIDADLYFYSSPEILFSEMGSNDVLITEHRFTAQYDRSAIAGKYCVQFITFKNNTNGRKVLDWWSNACLEWCYDRYEDGKFGDQKYLDDWTTRFNGVHVLKHLGGGMAPWNIQQYSISNTPGLSPAFTELSTGIHFNAVFYHYHFVRFYSGDLLDLGWFRIRPEIVKNLYLPYIRRMKSALAEVQQIEPEFKESLRPFSMKDADTMKEKVKFLFKWIFRYQLYSIKNILI